MIIQRDRPFANKPASCKWSSGGTSLLQIIIHHPRHPTHLCQDTDSISRTFQEQFVLVFMVVLLLRRTTKTTKTIEELLLQSLDICSRICRILVYIAHSLRMIFSLSFICKAISFRQLPVTFFIVGIFLEMLGKCAKVSGDGPVLTYSCPACPQNMANSNDLLLGCPILPKAIGRNSGKACFLSDLCLRNWKISSDMEVVPYFFIARTLSTAYTDYHC